MVLPEPPCPLYLMNRGKGIPTAQKIKKGGAYTGKEVMRLVNHDIIRDLLVPSDAPNIYPAVLEKCEYNRIKKNAKVETTAEKIAKLQQQEALRRQKVEACLARQSSFQASTQPVSEDPCRKPDYALARAYELRQEQDDTIKRFNRFILGSKCLAIRDAQLAEKSLLRKEMAEEEKRLDDMMEQGRRKVIEKIENERKERILKTRQYVQHLKEQIKENEITKLLNCEEMEEECRRLQAAAVQLKLEEIEARKQRVCQMEQIRKDLQESNRQLKHFKELEEQEDKIAELRIQEFHRKKAEWEDQRERERKAEALTHNQGFAKLWGQQEKQCCMKEKLTELNEQRIQDEIERQWRRKEQEAARKRCEANKKLQAERIAQLEDQRRMKALEMAREKQEFETVLKTQRAAALKEDEREKQRKIENEKHLRIILNQMTEKECERIRAKQESFEDGCIMKLQEDCHNRQINELMCKKLQDLRAHNIPETYVKEIERQMKRTKAK